MFVSCRFLPVSLFLLVSLCAAAAIPPPPPPNIVWIIADDMSPDTAAYGLRDVKTPRPETRCLDRKIHT